MKERPTAPQVPGRGSGRVEDLLSETFPRMLMIQTTSFCNASCVFCPLPSLRRTLPQGRMDPDLFDAIIEEAGRYPSVSCLNLFLMNEPLTDPRIVGRITGAKAQNPQAQISLWTNAVGLTPRMTRELLASPLSSLGVSLHAHNPASYRRATGRRDFYRVLKNLVHFVEQRLARRPDLTVVIRYVDAAHHLAPEEKDALRSFWSEGQVALDIDEGYLSRAGNLAAPASVREPIKRLNGCKALGGPKQAHILYTGQVVLCCMDYRRVTYLGDLREESLAAIWQGDRRRRLLQMLFGQREAEEDFLCSRCELAVPEGEVCAENPDVPPEALWAVI